MCGETALMEASENGHLNIVKHLIANGADINATDNEGNTALMYASHCGYICTVKYLVENGSNLFHKNESNETALLDSINEGYYEITNHIKQSIKNRQVSAFLLGILVSWD